MKSGAWVVAGALSTAFTVESTRIRLHRVFSASHLQPRPEGEEWNSCYVRMCRRLKGPATMLRTATVIATVMSVTLAQGASGQTYLLPHRRTPLSSTRHRPLR
jgi:hypothetical protein